MAEEARKIGITGATGYVGAYLGEYLARRGWQVVALSRRPPADAFWQEWRAFSLGAGVTSELLLGLDGVIHCAWDFRATTANAIWEINGAGSLALLQALNPAQCRRSIFISSASAYEGCRSLYGKSKLALEKEFLEAGALVVRPGLIFSDVPGGTYGSLVNQVCGSRFLPNFIGSACLQRLLHAEDLALAVHSFLEEHREPPRVPVFLAHHRDIRFIDVLRHIATQQNKAPWWIPMPWPLLWGGLRIGEMAGMQLGFRSDSLLGLVFYNPAPDYETAGELGWNCRPYLG